MSIFDIENVIACPTCQKTLERSENYFYCRSCKNKFLIRDQILNFISKDGKYSDAPNQIMDDILSKMENENWQEIIYQSFAQKDPWLYQIITDHTRTDYLFLNDFNKNDLVLDAGSGWGQSAFALAGRVNMVVAIDPNYRRIRFITKRANQEKIKTIIPIQANLLSLPFKTDSFDFISLIGVLEWVAVDTKSGDPRQLQIKALQELFRVLKEGKTLCIGIENSNSWAYRFGKPDDHTGIKFISYLPREEANTLSREKTGKDYRTYTYTKEGYVELLQEAGFSAERISFYYPIPSYKEPVYVAPLASANILKYFHKNLISRNPANSLEEKVRQAEIKSIDTNDYHNRVSSYFIFVQK